jgi:hypothetical protein
MSIKFVEKKNRRKFAEFVEIVPKLEIEIDLIWEDKKNAFIE